MRYTVLLAIEESADGVGGVVDGPADAELYIALGEVFDDVPRIRQGAGEPVEFGDDEGVAGPDSAPRNHAALEELPERPAGSAPRLAGGLPRDHSGRERGSGKTAAASGFHQQNVVNRQG
jgi:hypothetical protein